MNKMTTVKKSAVCMITACIGYGVSNARAVTALEEVVVEAQKKVETTFDTPIAVAAITGEQFQRSAGFSFADLTKQIPGFSLDGNTTPDIHMRGVSTVTTVNAPTRTNVYQDGVLRQDLRAVLGLQYDLERFEVLRGPQATLYGKPSPAGTINIRTKNPNLSEIDGYVAGTLGSRHLGNAQVGVSIPIIENELGVRLSAGYDDNQSSGVRNTLNDRTATTRLTGGRVVVLWQPNDDFTARLSYAYWEKDENFWYAADGGGVDQSDRKMATNVDDYQVTHGNVTVLELEKVLTDNLELVFVSSYEESNYRSVTDGDGTSSPQDLQLGTIHTGPYVQEELRLVSNDNDFWDWQLGVYYNHATTRTNVLDMNNLILFPPNPVAVNTQVTPHFTWEENAVFTHNTFKLTDELNAIFGVRYENIRFIANQPTVINIPAFGSVTRLDAIPEQGRHQTFHAFSGTAKLQYYFTPDLVGYLSYDHSFTRGSANLNISGNTPNDFKLVDPETSNSMEVGLKGNFWDDRGRFALTAFYQVYKGFAQDFAGLTTWNPATNQAQPLFSLVVNAKEVEVKGMELETSFQLAEDWSTNVSVSYNLSEYTDFKNAPCNPTAGQTLSASVPYVTCDLSGESLPFAPRWATALGSNYSHTLFDGIDWYFNAAAKGTGWQYDQVTRKKLGGYMTADFFFGVRPDTADSWDVSLWVKNAFDKRVTTRIYRQVPARLGNGYQVSGGAFERLFTNPPRQVGITGTYRF